MTEEILKARGVTFVDATLDSTDGVIEFLRPFVEAEQLLPRTKEEIQHLLKHGFMAMVGDRIVGFATVEIYSRKLSEIQCLAVDAEFQDIGIGRRLVKRCLERARELGVLELMAISASENLFKSCGFDYSLPMQKRALFIQPQAQTDSASSTD